MAYFHGTSIERLASILMHGLGATVLGPNSEMCERGVPLAADPRLSIAVLMMHYANGASFDMPPAAELASWRIIVVDDARIDARKLEADPQVKDWEGAYLYR